MRCLHRYYFSDYFQLLITHRKCQNIPFKVHVSLNLFTKTNLKQKKCFHQFIEINNIPIIHSIPHKANCMHRNLLHYYLHYFHLNNFIRLLKFQTLSIYRRWYMQQVLLTNIRNYFDNKLKRKTIVFFFVIVRPFFHRYVF